MARLLDERASHRQAGHHLDKPRSARPPEVEDPGLRAGRGDHPADPGGGRPDALRRQLREQPRHQVLGRRPGVRVYPAGTSRFTMSTAPTSRAPGTRRRRGDDRLPTPRPSSSESCAQPGAVSRDGTALTRSLAGRLRRTAATAWGHHDPATGFLDIKFSKHAGRPQSSSEARERVNPVFTPDSPAGQRGYFSRTDLRKRPSHEKRFVLLDEQARRNSSCHQVVVLAKPSQADRAGTGFRPALGPRAMVGQI